MSKMYASEHGIYHMAVGGLVKTYCLSDKVVQECKEINEKYLKGIPQDDELVVDLVAEKIATLSEEKGIIVDAFPLSIGQAKAFEEIAKKEGFMPPQALYMGISLETALARISTRKICTKCGAVYSAHQRAYETDLCEKCGGALMRRLDDRPEVVTRRYSEYATRLAPVVAFYREEGRMHDMTGEGSVEEGYSHFTEAMRDIAQTTHHE